MTYRIPSENLETLRSKLEKLSRRAQKLGQPAITMTLGEVEAVTYTDQETGFELIRTFFPVEITGAEPKIGGWTFVATLEHAGEAGTIIRSVPGTGDLPEKYRDATPETCDHCGYFRNRKDTFVLRSEQNEYKQVGRQCIRDFIGWGNPDQIAKYAEILTLVGELMNGSEDGDFDNRPRNYRYIPVGLVLQLASSAIRQFGWLSRANAEKIYGRATSERVADTLFPPFDKKGWVPLDITDEDKTLAETALDWTREYFENKELNDYEHNLNVITKSEYVEPRSVGLTCSLIFYYQRQTNQLAERKARDESKGLSEHVGSVGVRQEFVAKVISIRAKDSDYGIVYITNLMQGDNALVWFGSKELDVDTTYTFKATVKGHGEFNGQKQTTITRVMGEKKV